jgi:hypothetical protein
MRTFEIFFALIPIKVSLRMFFLSSEYVPSILHVFVAVPSFGPDLSLLLLFFSSLPSYRFINYMIYPSLALFLGTGNATPNLPSVMMEVSFLSAALPTSLSFSKLQVIDSTFPSIIFVCLQRLYTSPTYGMWYPIDPKSLSSNLPPMVVFPHESEFYQTWKETLESRGVKVYVLFTAVPPSCFLSTC